MVCAIAETGWLDIAKTLSPAFVALVIGVATVVIAVRQVRIAAEQRRLTSERLSLDLFDRRFEVFSQTWSLLSMVTLKERAAIGKCMTAFHNSQPRAAFLFGPDIVDYMSEVHQRVTAHELVVAEAEMQGVPPPSEHVAPDGEATQWIREQAKTGARSRFGKYLDFGQWRPGE